MQIKSNNNKFIISDPTCSLKEEYLKIWSENYDYDDGLITTKDGSFIVLGTGGDGYFEASNGINYSIDGGCIAIIPENLVNLNNFNGSSHISKYAKMQFNNNGYIEVDLENEAFSIETYYSKEDEYEDEE